MRINGSSMTKKKGSHGKAPEANTPEKILREMADNLRLHADYLDQCIAAYKELGSPPIRVLPGNFYHYLKLIRSFFVRQVISKMSSASMDERESHHKIFSELYDLKGVLVNKMPKGSGKENDDER